MRLMWPSAPPGGRWRASLLRRLDRAAGKINPYLMLVAIGLAVLDLAGFIALTQSAVTGCCRPEVGRPALIGVPPLGNDITLRTNG